MKIGIDIRSLIQPHYSGISEYTYNLLKALFRIDKINEYFLFSNSYKDLDLPLWNFENVSYCNCRYPNKLINFSFKFLKYPKLDSLIERKKNCGKLDIFFLPNLNFVSFSTNIKKVLTVHDLSFEKYPKFFSFKKRIWHKAINPKKLTKTADKIIAVSNNTKKDLMDFYNLKESKIEVIYPGINEIFSGANLAKQDLDRVRKKYDLPENFFLFLGTVEPRKNILGLINAYKIFQKRYWQKANNFKLVIAGAPGWLYKDVFRAVEQDESMCGSIKFLGYVEIKDKPAIYKLAKLFIYPSFYEGFGFPPLEAMACGTPVITSHTSSLSEIIGQAALTVDPYNAFELAEQINNLACDSELRNYLIERGLKRSSEFRWEKSAQKVKNIFENLK